MKGLIYCISLVLISQLHAEAVGDIRFMATIKSFDQNWVQVTVGGKEYRVPIGAVKGDHLALNSQREVTLSQEEFAKMRNRRVIADTTKK